MPIIYDKQAQQVVLDDETKNMFKKRHKLQKILQKHIERTLYDYTDGVPSFAEVNKMVKDSEITYVQAKKFYKILHDYEHFILTALASSERVETISN